jgi:hypothetical protein
MVRHISQLSSILKRNMSPTSSLDDPIIMTINNNGNNNDGNNNDGNNNDGNNNDGNNNTMMEGIIAFNMLSLGPYNDINHILRPSKQFIELTMSALDTLILCSLSIKKYKCNLKQAYITPNEAITHADT